MTSRYPAYRNLLDSGELELRVLTLREALFDCHVCPRDCGADRRDPRMAQCGVGLRALLSSAHPHFGEEPPISGRYGSGALFFAGCSLHCWFCQNPEISHGRYGRPIIPDELAAIMLRLQDRGCHNINLVTPTHVVPQILEALYLAALQSLNIPVVYNSSGYDSVETLRLLDGVVDIYMPDIKYSDGNIARRLSGAPDYPEVVRDAIREMHRQVGDLVLSRSGLARRGLLVRHLVLPNDLANTAACMDFLAREISTETYVNLMDQYHPAFRSARRPEVDRRLTTAEFGTALEAARVAGLRRVIH